MSFQVERYPFLETQASDRKTWFEVLQDERPTVDKNGYLDGEWGRAVVAACRYEHSHPDWATYPSYEGNGPAGFVSVYMDDKGYGDFMPSLDKLEEETHKALDVEEGLPGGGDNPRVWSTPICEPKGYHAMMQEALGETFWLYVCCCCGTGFGSCGDPCCATSQKCCCIESAMYSEDVCGDEGPCFMFQKCCCIVQHQTLWPGGGPDDGVPCCSCCNMRCGGEDEAEVAANSIVNTNAQILKEAFLCYYCLCCGCGLSMNFPMIKLDQKYLCLRTFGSTASCWPEDRGICYKYEKACCCASVCTFPPGGGRFDGVPMCACCGQNCGGETDKDDMH